MKVHNYSNDYAHQMALRHAEEQARKVGQPAEQPTESETEGKEDDNAVNEVQAGGNGNVENHEGGSESDSPSVREGEEGKPSGKKKKGKKS